MNDLWDAMVYCSTCLSVGYGDIFAKTPVGKILGSTLMTVGPALSGAALDGRVAQREAVQQQTQEQILQALQLILQTMNGAQASSPSTGTPGEGRGEGLD